MSTADKIVRILVLVPLVTATVHQVFEFFWRCHVERRRWRS